MNQQNRLIRHSKSVRASARFAIQVLVALLALTLIASAQNAKPQSGAAKTGWQLSVVSANPVRLTVTANEIPLKTLAAELSKQLQVPVTVSALLQGHSVTLKADDALLEGVLRSLAPQVFVDYALSSAEPGSVIYLGIYLSGINEPPPAPDASTRARSQMILLEGNSSEADEETRAPADPDKLPLQVRCEQGLLTVRARQQPLRTVVFEIAGCLGVPFEFGQDNAALVDLKCSGCSPEEILRLLPAGVRLYLRRELPGGQTRALRFKVTAASPDSSVPGTAPRR
ncbi:MAG: hypothetical protein U0Z53_06475 [Blastocatellia bacterium]